VRNGNGLTGHLVLMFELKNLSDKTEVKTTLSTAPGTIKKA
jgi:hypothetical protein